MRRRISKRSTRKLKKIRENTAENITVRQTCGNAMLAVVFYSVFNQFAFISCHIWHISIRCPEI